MTVREVLVLRALGLGDFLTGVPAYRALRRAFPDAHLTLASPSAFAPLVRLVGGIDRLLPTEGLGRLAYEGRPDLAVNLHGAGPESIDDLQSTRPRRLLTHAHPQRVAVQGPEWLEDQHEVVRWCRLLATAGIVATPTDLRLAEPRERTVPIPDAVVIHPGAAAPARRWPSGRYAVVARWLSAKGHRVVITGGRSESGLAAQVLHAAGLPRNRLLVDLDLADLAALVAGARLVICGDTGVAHLATAYGTRSVILFGPTSPAHWGPPRSGAHTVLWSGHVGNPHGRRPDPGLLEIGVDAVLEAATGRLNGSASAYRIGRPPVTAILAPEM
ncbi:MAG TPA: glycosyltransferase family 9 protein [Propionibacteriaceae bacterium]|nr:glycosyltransferase family 9 protein [Propionibacteriaceae bacterium]